MKRYIDQVRLAWLIVVLASCNSQPLTTSVPAQETPKPIATPTSLPGRTQAPAPTAVQEPVTTPTLVPTLSSELRESEIRQILQDDMACKPPCFLSIVPGKTTSQELERMISRYGLPITYSETHGVYSIDPLLHDDFPPEAGFFIRDGVVTSTKIHVDPSNPFEWTMYSPSALLKRYGIPTKVDFNLGGIHEPSDTPQKGWYGMRMYYDDLDFIIEYGDAEVTLGKLITVCPNRDPFSSVRIWLGRDPDHPPLDSTPLEQATSLPLEKFTDYLPSGPGACFELNGEGIPID
jgi:hypothetical protein